MISGNGAHKYKMYKGVGVRFAGFIYFFLISHEDDSILKWGGGGGQGGCSRESLSPLWIRH